MLGKMSGFCWSVHLRGCPELPRREGKKERDPAVPASQLLPSQSCLASSVWVVTRGRQNKHPVEHSLMANYKQAERLLVLITKLQGEGGGGGRSLSIE